MLQCLNRNKTTNRNQPYFLDVSWKNSKVLAEDQQIPSRLNTKLKKSMIIICRWYGRLKIYFFFLGFGFVAGEGQGLQIPVLLDPMLGFSFCNWLRCDKLHLSQTHQTSTYLPPISTQKRSRDALTPQRLFCTVWKAFFFFSLNIYEQAATMRGNRTTSCYKHLKIAPDSESCWKKTLHLPPAYKSIAFGFFLSILKPKKNDEYVGGNEEGSVWMYLYKNISQVPSTPSASFKIFWLVLYLCKSEKPFNLFSLAHKTVLSWYNLMGSLQCNHTSELSMDTYAWSSASYSPVPQTYSPAHQTRLQERSWSDRSCLWKALCHALRSCQQLGYFFMTDYIWFMICLIVPNHIRWSLGKVVPRAGHLQEQGKMES